MKKIWMLAVLSLIFISLNGCGFQSAVIGSIFPDDTGAAGEEAADKDTPEDVTETVGEDSPAKQADIVPEGSIAESGTCGANVSWNLYEDGTLVISGEGAIDRNTFANGDVMVISDNSKITRLKIEDGITGIGIAAFMGCTSLTEAQLGNDIEYIDSHAFQGCTSMVQIWMPDTVTFIGAHVFDSCRSLENITLPSGISKIYEGTFLGCRLLKSIEIPDGITYIGNEAFERCEVLETVVIPEGVEAIGESAFEACYGLKSVEIPSSVTIIGEWAFYTADATFGEYNNLTDIYYRGSEEEWNKIICGFSCYEDSGIYGTEDDWNIYDEGVEIGQAEDLERELFYITRYGAPEIHYQQ